MVDPDVLEPIAARRVELDELEDQQAKQLDQVRAERDELAVAERVLARMAEQLAVRMSRPCCRRRRSRVASRGAAGPPGARRGRGRAARRSTGAYPPCPEDGW
ncbi:hypothetical protein [Kitasatospora indigofera]|uniref:hypothetical protein n=1 Tax=Kitasatospora indigofera TaxID=67307 RepID=UPI00368C9E70